VYRKVSLYAVAIIFIGFAIGVYVGGAAFNNGYETGLKCGMILGYSKARLDKQHEIQRLTLSVPPSFEPILTIYELEKEIKMAFNPHHFRDLICRVLLHLDSVKPGMYDKVAVELLMGTAAQESAFGSLLHLSNGTARGVFQIEPRTERDIWRNYLKYETHLRDCIERLTGVDSPNELMLEGNLIYQIVLARLVYARAPVPLPDRSKVTLLAKYWKQWYNTSLGKGTVRSFIENWRRYVES